MAERQLPIIGALVFACQDAFRLRVPGVVFSVSGPQSLGLLLVTGLLLIHSAYASSFLDLSRHWTHAIAWLIRGLLCTWVFGRTEVKGAETSPSH